jgi:Domain of unknown function (DUF3841)
MRVWMITAAALYTQLEGERILYVDPALAEKYFEKAYAWMRGQMAVRLPHYEGHWPWWAWVRPPCGHARPDLRARQPYHNGWPMGTPCVRLGLDVPDDDLLVSNFDMWHAVLNDSPLVSSDEAWDAIDALPEADRRAAREATWLGIFAVDEPPDPYWHGSKPPVIQACFEVLRLADVREVTLFRARPTRW